MSTFKFPEYKTISYTLNPETGKYQKDPERMPFNKLPYELKVEPTQEPKIKANGANEIITGRIKNGKRLFFTGLVPVYNSAVWYLGNDYQFTTKGKTNSLVVFQFSIDNARLIIYYFNHYYIHNRNERIGFVGMFIKHKGDH
ncbi:MAG: hypothetical protein ACK44D_09660 [Bacteroidia bacterium]